MPLYATLNRVYYGLGGGSLQPAREVYELLGRWEAVLKDSVPVPYVSVVPTWESLQRWRVGGSSFNFQMSEGFFLAMLDAGVAVDVCPSTEMSREWLSGQRVVALCGASGIQDEQARLLTDWVKDGGRLLATYDTGLYDEKGRLRKDGGALREALGLEMAGEPGPALPDSYYRIGATHPALAGYGSGAMIQGDNRMVPVRLTGGAAVLADCWNLGEARSPGPAIVLHHLGKGRVIYVNGSLEAYYPASRVSSTRRVLESLVRYLGDAPLPFRVSAPVGVYGVLRRATNGDLALWVLAPVGFKDASAGMMRQQFLPVRNVEVRVRVPEGRRVRGVKLARAARTVPHTMSDGYALVKLPELNIAELVHFQLA